ncbi:HAD family hydrolase [Tepidibacter aestuarii]|uniref:HAD family hydrolase n=1 Tax=Tepidibacter aestuarii TaxID=2925782 RepID=UPI0020BD4845|nr:HAD family hydrolase [Tepidibacter aestuarii]CAH2211993.1 Hpr-associated pyrophosphatase [Tepidibacter aestuarii]
MNLIMFDFDGVIIDSLEQFTKDFISACNEHGLLSVNSQKDMLDLFDNNVYESILSLGIDEFRIDEILSSYKRNSQNNIFNSKLFDGVKDMLQSLSLNNKVFIITSNISSLTNDFLRLNGVDCVEDVIGADIEKSKIKKIKHVIDLYPNLSPYYVGDTKGDMIEGKISNAKTIGVTWGWHTLSQLKNGGADFIVNSPDDILDIFKV